MATCSECGKRLGLFDTKGVCSRQACLKSFRSNLINERKQPQLASTENSDPTSKEQDEGNSSGEAGTDRKQPDKDSTELAPNNMKRQSEPREKPAALKPPEIKERVHADQSIDVPKNNESVGSGTAVFVTAVAWGTLGISLLAAIIFWVQAGDICSYYCNQYERIEKRSLVVMGWSSAVGGMLTSTLLFALGKITKHLSEIADSLKSD